MLRSSVGCCGSLTGDAEHKGHVETHSSIIIVVKNRFLMENSYDCMQFSQRDPWFFTCAFM
jgi:hypothetical protein